MPLEEGKGREREGILILTSFLEEGNGAGSLN